MEEKDMKKTVIMMLLATALITGCGAGGAASTAPEEAPAENAGEETLMSEVAQEEARKAAEENEKVIDEAAGVNEGMYAVINGIRAMDITGVSYSGDNEGSLGEEDMKYLIKDLPDGVRIDIPGVPAGNYDLKVTTGDATYVAVNIAVTAYDRSGYAHFNYDRGVGAYNDDGSLKENAIVLYVTDENKNDVELTYDGVTVKGIGNILNSGGAESEDGKTGKGGIANDNQGIIKKLAEAGIPLDVRIIGVVSESGLYEKGEWDPDSEGLIDGLTAYSIDKEAAEAAGVEVCYDYGANPGDNGHMARMVSGRDITIEGIGYDATIDGWGFHFIAGSSDADSDRGESFEVRNLTFINTAEDATGMEGSQDKNEEGKDDVNGRLNKGVERCWIHNNEYYCPKLTSCADSEGDKFEGDGSIDFKKGQYLTASYNYFEGSHKTSLIGGNDSALQFNVTYHHNHWYMCGSRGPLARNANIHMYNNISEYQTKYCQNMRFGGYIFSEYNLFFDCRNPHTVDAGAIKSFNDNISGVIWEDYEGASIVTDKSEKVENTCSYNGVGIDYSSFDTDPALSYIPEGNYVCQTDFTQLRKVIAAYCGTQKEKPVSPEDITEEEYSVIPKDAQINELPAQGVSLQNMDFVFTLEAPAAVVTEYTKGEGVLVNAAGECLLEGSGESGELPAGTYMIRSKTFTVGDYAGGIMPVFDDLEMNVSLK